MPTAQEGTPPRGDGYGPPSVGGLCKGGGNGPHACVGWRQHDKRHSRRGTAAAPQTGNDRNSGYGLPPPPWEKRRPWGGRAGPMPTHIDAGA